MRVTTNALAGPKPNSAVRARNTQNSHTSWTKHRGLDITKVDVGLATGPDEFTGAYDATSDLVEQVYPGGVTASWTRDVTGAATALSYTKGSDELMAFTQAYDHLGRVRDAANPDTVQKYRYDDRDRLSKVEDTYQGACQTRTYAFDGDSNRTSAKTYGPGTGGVCQDSSVSSTVSTTFDTGDRITTAGYVHDKLGRATTVPAVHTDQPAGSNLVATYYANDMVASLTQTVPDGDGGTNVAKQAFSLDASDRVSVTKGYTDGVQLAESTNHYASGSDSPAWSESKTRPDASTAWVTAWSRNVAGLGGGLAIIQPQSGTPVLQLPDLRGNVAATSLIRDAGLNSYASYLEYGQPRGDTTLGEDYGWLGTHQRKSVGVVGGVSLMGARLYGPVAGRFLSRDSVRGGNDNAYVYPADPINMRDLDGRVITIGEGGRGPVYIMKVNGKSVAYAGARSKVASTSAKTTVAKTTSAKTTSAKTGVSKSSKKAPALGNMIYKPSAAACRTSTGYWHPNGCTPGVGPASKGWSAAGTTRGDAARLRACTGVFGGVLMTVGGAAGTPWTAGTSGWLLGGGLSLSALSAVDCF